MKVPVLVVGGDGTLGHELCGLLRARGIDFVATTRRPQAAGAQRLLLDLTASSFDAVEARKWGTVILAAALTSMKQCEENTDLARRINVDVPVALAQRLGESGAHIVFLSSNAVFSGQRPLPKEDDATDPITAYGRQKAEAEHRIRFAAGSVAIVRMTKVIHGTLPVFKVWERALVAGQWIEPFLDLVVSPISLNYAVQGVLAAAQGISGVFHLSGAADMTYADLAREYVRLVGLDSSRIRPTTSRAAGMELVALPQFSALDMARTTESLGVRAQSLRDAMRNAVSS